MPELSDDSAGILGEMQPQRESPNLDLLRSIAVLSVYGYPLALALGSKPHYEIGRFGVLIFFVHTSLVLMMSLARLEAKGQSLFSVFYLRRFFRIYPLSVVCVLIVAAFHLPRAPWWPWSAPGAGAIAANVLLCMNVFYIGPVITVLWSLPYEVEMYLVLPFLYLAGKRWGWRGIGVLWAASVGFGLAQPHISGRLDIVRFGPCFLAGVLAYFLGDAVRERNIRWGWWAVSIVTGAGILAAFTAVHLDDAGSWVMCLLLGVTCPFIRDLNRAVAEGDRASGGAILLRHLSGSSVCAVGGFYNFARSALVYPRGRVDGA